LFTESRVIKSILWGQRFSGLPIEQLIPMNLGARIHSIRAVSRESLIEQAFCVRPDLLIFETDTPGEKIWSQLLLFTKSKTPEMGLIAIVSEMNPDLIKDIASAQVDGIIRQDRIHLELTHAIRAFQKNEIFISSSIAKMLCSFIQVGNSGTPSEPTRQDIGLLSTLTNREMEVLACLTQGMNYKSIAKRLFVSDSTVKTHVNNIFTKLNVNDRTQAVLYGLKHGIDRIAGDIFKRIDSSHAPQNAILTANQPMQNPALSQISGQIITQQSNNQSSDYYSGNFGSANGNTQTFMPDQF
jgi:two-component system response regulator DegU